MITEVARHTFLSSSVISIGALVNSLQATQQDLIATILVHSTITRVLVILKAGAPSTGLSRPLICHGGDTVHTLFPTNVFKWRGLPN